MPYSSGFLYIREFLYNAYMENSIIKESQYFKNAHL